MNTDFDVDKSKEEFKMTNINLFIMLKMKISALTTLFVLVIGIESAYTQGFWEPVTNVTGYISTEFNYFDDLDGYDINYTAAVSEAGLLISHRPSSNFSIKGVFVYRPGFEFDQMLNEAFGELSVSEKVNFKAGRFLLPLSPTNTFYYAPVNTSATLPILVTNHEFFPITIDGVSVNGYLGNDFKVAYDVFAGGYKNSTWLQTGAVKFFGDEVSYFKEQINSLYTVDPSYNKTYNLGIGGRLGFSYKSFVDVGFSAFKQKDEQVPLGVNFPENALYPGSPATYSVQKTDFEKTSYGVSLKLQYSNTKLVGEYWDSKLGVYNEAIGISNDNVDLEGSFVELSHRFNSVTPYVRYEDQVTDDIDYQRFTAGVNYKPSFTRTLKLEYMRYTHESGNINGVVATLIYSF